ncbi:hypothetical protein CYMTET_32055 [Cymbomonas tetramitiformis]|uniref:ATPase AAA-type core domain-containing protein n=1 Tax=Cymbomonas tetramitiformis TaxID=36881 RepID=A0AAE0FFT7_9CHLO|nr:hypothetical protein CYMTET_32055 [Cymbomonas tetramitiformis]
MREQWLDKPNADILREREPRGRASGAGGVQGKGKASEKRKSGEGKGTPEEGGHGAPSGGGGGKRQRGMLGALQPSEPSELVAAEPGKRKRDARKQAAGGAASEDASLKRVKAAIEQAEAAAAGGKAAGGTRETKTLILFEEVDTLFEDDRGFMTALATLISTAKRPLILTSNTPHVPSLPDLPLRRLAFAPAPPLALAEHISLVCLAERFPLPPPRALALARRSQGDIRRALMHAQLLAPTVLRCSRAGGMACLGAGSEGVVSHEANAQSHEEAGKLASRVLGAAIEGGAAGRKAMRRVQQLEVLARREQDAKIATLVVELERKLKAKLAELEQRKEEKLRAQKAQQEAALEKEAVETAGAKDIDTLVEGQVDTAGEVEGAAGAEEEARHGGVCTGSELEAGVSEEESVTRKLGGLAGVSDEASGPTDGRREEHSKGEEELVDARVADLADAAVVPPADSNTDAVAAARATAAEPGFLAPGENAAVAMPVAGGDDVACAEEAVEGNAGAHAEQPSAQTTVETEPSEGSEPETGAQVDEDSLAEDAVSMAAARGAAETLKAFSALAEGLSACDLLGSAQQPAAYGALPPRGALRGAPLWKGLGGLSYTEELECGEDRGNDCEPWRPMGSVADVALEASAFGGPTGLRVCQDRCAAFTASTPLELAVSGRPEATGAPEAELASDTVSGEMPPGCTSAKWDVAGQVIGESCPVGCLARSWHGSLERMAFLARMNSIQDYQHAHTLGRRRRTLQCHVHLGQVLAQDLRQFSSYGLDHAASDIL